MDGFGKRTIKNIKMSMEVDGWTDGRKSVREGLVKSEVVVKVSLYVKDSYSRSVVIHNESFQ